jgi:phage gpG-like protein
MREIEDFAKHKAPEVVGQIAVEFYKDSFLNEGFTDKTLEKWPAVKRPERKRRNSKILVGTDNLRRSIKPVVEESKVSVHAEVYSKNNFNYAPVHNFGTNKIPQRQFVGESETLNEKIHDDLERRVDDILRS